MRQERLELRQHLDQAELDLECNPIVANGIKPVSSCSTESVSEEPSLQIVTLVSLSMSDPLRMFPDADNRNEVEMARICKAGSC